ncbi:DUF1761 domain-containing protein [Fulvivirga lutimaris]|uniref:DUF1761 domain-containing protein n=1 Tax=Fulvivirga lutimaris TaxID=1819566 RepID=UPI0012BC7C91|nr:DUF1761 domain-containing protein [Fulvivirga lutimaris]MTI37932.1 DUF1761 domain-containing protein [Fulvivirga lutimaris]
MESINWLAIIVATLLTFVLGAIWYGPLFGKRWMRENGFNEEDLKNANMAKIYGTAFVLEFIMTVNLAFFLNGLSVQEGLMYGFATGFGWVAMALGVNYLFARKSMMLWFIDGFYFVVSFLIMGAILTAWT